jgi:hypothetical protein
MGCGWYSFMLYIAAFLILSLIPFNPNLKTGKSRKEVLLRRKIVHEKIVYSQAIL